MQPYDFSFEQKCLTKNKLLGESQLWLGSCHWLPKTPENIAVIGRSITFCLGKLFTGKINVKFLLVSRFMQWLIPEKKCWCRPSVWGEHAEIIAFICRTCMCHKQIELQLSTCLLFMLIWMNNKTNMFSCTQLSRSQKVNQLLSVKPNKTVIAVFYPSNNRPQIATYGTLCSAQLYSLFCFSITKIRYHSWNHLCWVSKLAEPILKDEVYIY